MWCLCVCADVEERSYGGCEGPDAMYVKLISSDGHEFIVKREHALTSGTIKAMLSGPGEFDTLDITCSKFSCYETAFLYCGIQTSLFSYVCLQSNWEGNCNILHISSIINFITKLRFLYS